MPGELRGQGWIEPSRWTAQGPGLSQCCWYAFVSSRLGRHVEQRRAWFELLMRGVARAGRDGGAVMIVDRTAAAPWVQRAAALLKVPTVHLQIDSAADRDAALVGLADRVFALWVRRGGKIQRLLRQRLTHASGDTLWAAITGHPDCGGAELVRAGAVGWLAQTAPLPNDLGRGAVVPRQAAPIIPVDAVQWDQFLVHCTRARDGPLPGQSARQWRDEVLLAGDNGRAATAANVLMRILSCGWIHGGSGLTRGAEPVVCMSEVPLPQLLCKRTFRPHLGRWDYEPYGVAVRRTAARRAGAMPVVYGSDDHRRGLPPDQQWRFQAAGKTYDWTAEREWRLRGSLHLATLAADDAVVFVGDPADVGPMASLSRWPVVLWSPNPQASALPPRPR